MTCFFFNDTATTEIYTLSLHDALPIYPAEERPRHEIERPHVHPHRLVPLLQRQLLERLEAADAGVVDRSEEHTSELQSRLHLVCRLLLEKKKPCHIRTL